MSKFSQQKPCRLNDALNGGCLTSINYGFEEGCNINLTFSIRCTIFGRFLRSFIRTNTVHLCLREIFEPFFITDLGLKRRVCLLPTSNSTSIGFILTSRSLSLKSIGNLIAIHFWRNMSIFGLYIFDTWFLQSGHSRLKSNKSFRQP